MYQYYAPVFYFVFIICWTLRSMLESREIKWNSRNFDGNAAGQIATIEKSENNMRAFNMIWLHILMLCQPW